MKIEYLVFIGNGKFRKLELIKGSFSRNIKSSFIYEFSNGRWHNKKIAMGSFKKGSHNIFLKEGENIYESTDANFSPLNAGTMKGVNYKIHKFYVRVPIRKIRFSDNSVAFDAKGKSHDLHNLFEVYADPKENDSFMILFKDGSCLYTKKVYNKVV